MGKRAIVTARVKRACSLCGQIIEAGRQYVYKRVAPWESLDEDNGYWTYAAHPVCHLVWSVMHEGEPLPYDAYGELADEYTITRGELPTEEAALATLRAWPEFQPLAATATAEPK